MLRGVNPFKLTALALVVCLLVAAPARAQQTTAARIDAIEAALVRSLEDLKVALAAVQPGPTNQDLLTILLRLETLIGGPVPPGCAATLSPAAITSPAAGGAYSVAVTVPAGCVWTASASAAPWLVVTGGTGGTGPGLFTYRVDPNLTAQSRSSLVTIAGKLFLATQAAGTVPPVCTPSLLPGSLAAPAAGVTGQVLLTTQAPCAWTATSSAPWVTLSVASGTGPLSIGYVVAANPSTAPRSATATISGQLFTITQAGTVAPVCTFSLSPASATLPGSGGPATVNVLTQAGCPWMAGGQIDWANFTSGTTGTGPGTVAYVLNPNPTGAVRTVTFLIAGQSFLVTQAAAVVLPNCNATLSPVSASLSAAGGNTTVLVTIAGGCTWATSSPVPWITLSSRGVTGPGSLGVTVAPNPSTQARSATVTIASEAFVVSQAGTIVAGAVIVTPTSPLAFEASPSHALLTRYRLQILPHGSTAAAVYSSDLGLPTVSQTACLGGLVAPPCIELPIGWSAAQFAGIPAGDYDAVVTAESPGGTAASLPSNLLRVP